MIRDRIKSLRRVRAKDLIPNPKNPRTHPPAQRKALQAALNEIGYAGALLARQLPNGKLMLCDGHARAGLDPEQKVPVLVLDVTEEEAEKLMATFDPIGAMAGMDDGRMRTLLDSIEMDSPELQSMLDKLVVRDSKDGLTDPDAVPPKPDKPVTRSGDLIKLGRHRLLCGDATSKDDVAKLLGKTIPLVMVTDPPYGVNYDPCWRDAPGVDWGGKRRRGAVSNDDRIDWTPAWALFKGDVAYLWHAGVHAREVADSMTAAGLEIRSQIIWAKQCPVFGRGAYHWKHEPCWYAVRGGKTASWTGDRKQTTVWDIQNANPMGGKKDDADTNHSTQKPVECMERPIRNHGGKNDAVYDPFVGSGTTIIAAERQERACYAIEIDPSYCDIVVARWEAFTGEKAKRPRRRTKK